MPFNLRQTYLFARLDDDQFQQVTEFSRTIKLNDGQMLFQAGDAADRFFLVTTGQIKLYRLAMNGNEKVIEIISPGHTFAEALMFLESPGFPVNATAMGTTELVTIDNAQFLTMLRGSVDTCFRLMADMSQRLKLLIKEIDDLTLQSATGSGRRLPLGQVGCGRRKHRVGGTPKGCWRRGCRSSQKPSHVSCTTSLNRI